MLATHRPWLLAACLLVAPLGGCDEALLTTPAPPAAGPGAAQPGTAAPAAPARGGALVNRWEFENVVFFDDEGDTESTAWGEMSFKPDGTYVQSLHIGQFLNAEEGTYRVTGADTVMLTPKSGEARTLTFGVSDDRLSLTSTTPTLKTHYGLRRADP